MVDSLIGMYEAMALTPSLLYKTRTRDTGSGVDGSHGFVTVMLFPLTVWWDLGDS